MFYNDWMVGFIYISYLFDIERQVFIIVILYILNLFKIYMNFIF